MSQQLASAKKLGKHFQAEEAGPNLMASVTLDWVHSHMKFNQERRIRKEESGI
jgi:hypothetical protein